MQLLPSIKNETVETDPRKARAETLLEVFEAVKRNQDGTYTVASQWKPGTSYQVRLSLSGNASCNCTDAKYRRIECKHCIAVKEAAGRAL